MGLFSVWFLSLCFVSAVVCQVIEHDPSLADVVDLNANMTLLAEQKRAFAHEGPVWIKATNEVYFASGRYVNEETGAQRVEIMKINLDDNKVTKVNPEPKMLMVNGGTLYSPTEILFCSQGYNETPGALMIFDTESMNVSKLELKPALNFNSLNDVIISDEHDGYFFTDPTYGYASGFRSMPTLEPQVYYANRKTLQVNALETFPRDSRPNGLAQSLDGSTLYVSETGYIIGNKSENPDIPRAIYAFNITKGPNDVPVLTNKRFFVENVDNGVADVIKLDEKGNLYAAVQDGVNIYSPSGFFMGKLKIPKGEAVPSFTWAGKTLVILADTTIHSISLKVGSAPLPGSKGATVSSSSFILLAMVLLGLLPPLSLTH